MNLKMLNKLKFLLSRNRCYCGEDIDKAKLDELVGKAILVDVRSPQEFEEGHLDNAILLPEYEIEKNVSKILPDKTKTIIVYCSSGYRSKKAQKKLLKLGFKKVYNLCDGLPV